MKTSTVTESSAGFLTCIGNSYHGLIWINTSAMAQRYFSVATKTRNARWHYFAVVFYVCVCCVLWVHSATGQARVYPRLHAVGHPFLMPAKPLLPLPVSLCCRMVERCQVGREFSATGHLSDQFNLKSAIHQGCVSVVFRKIAGEHECGRGMDYQFLIGGATTLIAVVMVLRQSVCPRSMLKFNTLISLAYGPTDSVGVVVRKDRPPRGPGGVIVTGLVWEYSWLSFSHWSLISRLPSLFRDLWGVFLSRLIDRGRSTARALPV